MPAFALLPNPIELVSGWDEETVGSSGSANGLGVAELGSHDHVVDVSVAGLLILAVKTLSKHRTA